MTTSRRLSIAACLLVLLALPAAAKERFVFGYLQLEDDPRYEPHRAYTGLTLRDVKSPVDGARAAIRESRILGRALDLKFELVERTLAPQDDSVAAIEAMAAADGARVFLLDLPLDATRDAATALAQRDIVLFNIRHREDALRGTDCAPALYHTIPSHAMLMDGLAQYLAQNRWTDVLLLQGETEVDKTLGAAFQASARKFALHIVAVRDFVLSNDPRQREQSNIRLLTADVDYDVVFIADSTGEYGRYVPYRTQDPRPVVGTEGLVATAWHWTWERHGAPQLNQRFDRVGKRRMADDDWAAWAAVRALVEAVVRTKSTDIATLRAFMVSDDFTLDLYKGAPGNFRPWDHQLRQPILLHTHNAVVARAPLEGFLHETNTLDTLGADRQESACRLDR
jgi:ABC transporter substrate binding protein (PQQ-dependent alcohol dehydrogenase system)